MSRIDDINEERRRAAEHVPLDLQIAEVERELRMRANVYPAFIARKKLRQGEAEEHMRRMRAALATLISLRANQRAESDPDT